MMNMAPRRSNGFGWLARWKMKACSASVPIFFSRANDVLELAADRDVVLLDHLEVAVLGDRVLAGTGERSSK